MLSRLLIKYLFKIETEYTVFLGTKIQHGSLFIPVKTRRIWEEELISKKVESLLKLKWNPTESIIQKIAKDSYMLDVFGDENDYSEELFKLNAWHNSRDWNLNYLTKSDTEKAYALESMTILTRLRYESTSKTLHLNLKEKAPFMCLLTRPMIVKIPVVSLQYYVTIHSNFAFNSIRKAKHPQCDSLIDYLYEIHYLQQKTAVLLHEFLSLVYYSEKHKDDALFITAEINAIMSADLAFSYLKATIEKIVVLVGLTYGITNLDSKPKHKAKISALKEGLPQKIFENYYVQYMFEFFSSDSLDELNNYRSGLLHKRGIADLQPHNYVGKNAKSVPLRKIFLVLHEQHSKNSASLLGALAMLTDELVELDFPEVKFDEIP